MNDSARSWQSGGASPQNALAGPFATDGQPAQPGQNALAQMQQPQMQWADMRADPSMFMTARRNVLGMG